MSRFNAFLLFLSALSGQFLPEAAQGAERKTQPRINYNQDVRPILSNNCFQCHGRDEAAREADLRLDVPGDIDFEEVLARIASVDPDVRMPPPDVHEPLAAEKIETLKQWVAEGAEYQKHWSFVPPQPPTIPGSENSPWSDQAIDRFVLERLEQKGLGPSEPADRRTLIRRLSLDLIGLPPTLADIEEFESDASPLAYERLVDRIMEQPQFGEHMARYWLDLVRFADTNGLHHDHYREMTPYRDWVIRAFNSDMPFDDFIVAQVAGDLFAQPTQDQLVASGFNRLHLIIDRGTMLPEESFTRNVVDQVSSIGTAFLGLTLECAVCHDHKYDPITQRDFYQLFAFFNNFDGEPETGPRQGSDFVRGLQPPYLELPSPAQTEQLAALDRQIAELETRIAALAKQAEAAAKQAEAEAKQAESAAKQAGSDVRLAGETEARVDVTAAVQAQAEGPDAAEQLKRELEDKQRARTVLVESIPATLVMKERSEVRPAHILVRGNYDQPGEAVQRATPAFLPPLKNEAELKTRMDLARWLVSSENPLTARVAVNRFWQQLFGTGLVKSSEDFGTQGDAPSHPELLDFLTLGFVESGWDVKQLLRNIVLSKTYQQTSHASRERFLADPNNRWLARGSRYRLDAEVIRDQILATCGLLSTSLYGKSVKPPQPAGLWEVVAMPNSYPKVYVADSGDKIYRRSVYSFWKRALPPPQMTIFDAPTRESCVARRERTNTPLQALVIMNEQQYFAAAMSLADDLLQRSDLDDEQRVRTAYEMITCRRPTTETANALLNGWKEFRGLYTSEPEAAQAMLAGCASPLIASKLKREDFTRSQQIEFAAFSMVVHSLLNLDIARNRE